MMVAQSSQEERIPQLHITLLMTTYIAMHTLFLVPQASTTRFNSKDMPTNGTDYNYHIKVVEFL